MHAAVFIYLFCELFPANGWLTYKIYRSAHNPNNLKLKIDGSIYLGEEPQIRAEEGNAFDAGFKESDINMHERLAVTEKPIKTDINKVQLVEDKREANYTDDSELASLRDQLTSLGSLAVVFGTDKPVDKKGVGSKKKAENNHVPGYVLETLFPKDSGLRIGQTTGLGVTRMGYKKRVRHKVQDDERVRKFTEHVYRQTLQAFEQMKLKSDPHTQTKIDALAETYKKKFSDFVQRTRQTDIKTSQGTQNVILHTLDTSNLILERIVNFLKSDIESDSNLPSALREGGALRIDKEVDTVKETEYEHACKKFGVCRSSQGFRTVLQDIISICLKLSDHKLLQVNDAATEVLKNADLTAIADTVPVLYTLNRAIRTQERQDSVTLRTNLEILYGVLCKSHLPLMVDRSASFAKPAVKRTVAFRKLLDAVEVALPPTEPNKREWAVVKNRLTRWKDGAALDIQEIMQTLFDNIQKGIAKDGEIKQLVEDIVESNAE